MSAEFESGMFVKKGAWHQQGVVVETAPSPAKAMELAQMDWMVEKRELTYQANDGSPIHCDNHYAIVRDIDNRCLGYCSNQYEVWQNWQAFEWTQPLFESGLWDMETCGSLKKGEICWILMKQGEGEILPGDKLKQYLLMTWSHNGKMPNLIQPTSIRVVCNNTLLQAMGECKAARVCHKRSLPMTMEQVKGLFLSTGEQFKRQMEVFKRMLGTEVTDGDIEDLIEDLYGHTEEERKGLSHRGQAADENRVERVKRFVFDKASGRDLVTRNNAYYVFNALEELNEHYLVPKTTDTGWNILFGTGKKKTDEVYAALESRAGRPFLQKAV